MYSALLPIIYLTFVSLGLPDTTIGSAWPTMYSQVGADVGSLTMPPLMGVLGQTVGFGLYPLVLAALLAVMVVAGERVNHICG